MQDDQRAAAADPSAYGDSDGVTGARAGASGWMRRLREDKHAGRSARQYLMALETAFLSLDPEPAKARTFEAIEAIFAKYRSGSVDWTRSDVWDDAFRAERLLVGILGSAQVAVEIDRRILELQRLDPSLAEFYRGRISTPGPETPALTPDQETRNRILFGRLVTDLQWQYNQRDLKRRYAHEAQMRVTGTFLIALAAFAFVMYETFSITEEAQGGQVAAADVAEHRP